MITRCAHCNAPHACVGQKTIIFCDSACLSAHVADMSRRPMLVPGTPAFAILADVRNAA